jgi:hypothetical protein
MRGTFVTKMAIILLIHDVISENNVNNDKREMEKKESMCVYRKLAKWPAAFKSKKLFPGETDAKLDLDLAFSCGGNLIVNDKPDSWPCCSCGASCPDNLVDANCSCVAHTPAKADTKYPVVFAPSRMSLPSKMDRAQRFGGLLEYLEAMGGARVFNTTTATSRADTAEQCKSIAECADSFKKQILEILAIAGATKVNIIAHLEAGLYVRYAVTNLGLGPKVSSVTTINTPNRGSSLFDWELGEGVSKKSIISLLGIEEDYAMLLTRPYVVNIFNPNTPNFSGVYYQSYSSAVDLFWTGSTKNFFLKVDGGEIFEPRTL